ncbi:MAG: flagellar filament capping protein FliD [Lachnospiraceae bacterium]|nr:flagellar filament capping protein FliD [Lachnospiraceae bacterium]
MTGISGLNQIYYGGQTSSSIGTLLGSLGTPTGVNAMSSVLTDYRTIQTGTYGRLLKAYYAQEMDSSKSSSSKKSKDTDSISSKLKSSLSDTRSKMESLNTSASKLSNTGEDSVFNKKEIKQEDGTTKTDYDVDAIYGAVSGFVSDYNKALSSAASSSYKSVSNGADSMTSTTDVLSNSLKKIGITAGTNGKLELDEAKFKKSDMAKVKDVFGGSTGYASNIASTASRIAGTSSNKLTSLSSKYSYGKSGSYNAVDTSSLFNSYF